MHANARLTPVGRLTMVMRIESGWRVADVASQMGVSRQTASKWWGRWRAEGLDGLADRSSRPRTARIAPHPQSRRDRGACGRLKLGPLRIAGQLGVPAATVHRVLVSHRPEPPRVDWTVRLAG